VVAIFFVSLLITLLHKSFWTEGAFEWMNASMQPHVVIQRTDFSELFTTCEALKNLIVPLSFYVQFSVSVISIPPFFE